MKTSINKEYTTVAKVGRVRADLKEFKERYTDGDLLREFRDQTELQDSYGAEVLSATVEAFPKGDLFDDETTFCVELIAHSFGAFYEIRFYCDMSLSLDLRAVPWIDHPEREPMKMYSQKIYTQTA